MIKLFSIDQKSKKLEVSVEANTVILRPVFLDKLVQMIEEDVKENKNVILIEDTEYKIHKLDFKITSLPKQYIINLKASAFFEKEVIPGIKEITAEVDKEVGIVDGCITTYEQLKETE